MNKQEFDKIVFGIPKLEKELTDLENDFFSKRTILIDKIKVLQENCPHIITEYFPDASGNNDSWSECLMCGKQI